MLTCCAICSEPFPYHRPCDQAHEGVCHSCASLNLTGGFDSREHPAPRETARLTTREHQAVSAYTAMLLRTVGASGLGDLVTEEDGTP